MSIATIPKVSNKSDSDVHFSDTKKPGAVRDSNITAAKSVSDAIRTSLGPKGMDKMIVSSNGDVTITNDGATILNQMQLMHPVGKMLVSLSKAQDAEAGDGTTTVVVLAGCLLDAASRVLSKGIHPTVVSEAFAKAANQARKILTDMSIPVELTDRNSLLQSASTALSSKVVSQCSALLANIAVDAVLKIIPTSEELGGEPNVDLKNIRVLKKVSGTIDDTELIDGMVMDMGPAGYGGPTRIEKAKIALIQFCISAPKTDMEHNVVISDYTQLDRALREERQYILNIIKEIRKSGCNVLLIQKSILRDAASELALHLLAKSKIMVIKDVEREDVEFTCKSLGCRPIASLDHFKPEAFGKAELVEQISTEADSNKMVKFSGIEGVRKTVSIIIHGTNKLIVDEAERSLHDALCVIRCLVKEQALIAGGGAPEIEMALKLEEYAMSDLNGAEQYCVRAYADSLEIVPYTLAENAGLNSIATLTELRKRHAQGARSTGISVRKAGVADMIEENVIQPLLVSTSAIVLATEAVRQILKIDDFILAVRL